MTDAERPKSDVSDKAREFFSDFRVSRGLNPTRLVFMSVALGLLVSLGAAVQSAEPPSEPQAESISEALAEALHGPVRLRLRTVLTHEVETRHPR